MAEFLFQGHGSYRIKSEEGTVIYVDPYAGEGYDLPADIILVTHEHRDHNQIQLVTKKKDCILITEQEALKDNVYHTFHRKDINIESVPAYNQNHNINECVGYIIKVDQILFYASGDTSTTDFMEHKLSEYHLDYAVLPIDGIYNMGPEEAAKCAEKIGARYTIPIHMKPGSLFDKETAEKFKASNRLIVKASECIPLK